MYENQPAPDPFAQPTSSKPSPLVIVTLAGLSIVAVGLGLLSLVAFNQASAAKKISGVKTQAVIEAAVKAQALKDAAATELASESPFRSYVAPVEYGSFEIRFPKNWSATVQENRNGTAQVSLVANPNFIKSVNNIDDKTAAHIILSQRTLAEYIQTYTSIKNLKRADISIGGIPSVQFTGGFPDKRTNRLVAVPVRDKTLVFINEDPAYDGVLNQIMEQSRINP